jgi:peptidoglycan/LPS O-acetylase OafA/YrhL
MRIEFAQYLRGIAASAVVLSHLSYLIWRHPDTIGGLISYPDVANVVRGAPFVPLTDFGLPYFWGYFGVALFFLISGFVIPFSVSSLSRPGFIVARILRIWPTYLVGLGIAVICIALNSRLSNIAFPFSPIEVVTNALIFPRWPTLTRSIDGIGWTLEIEIFFYAFCALAAKLVRDIDCRLFLLTLPVVPLAYFVRLRTGTLIGLGMPIYALANWISSVPVYICFMLCGTAFYYHYRGRLSSILLAALQAFLLLAFVAGSRVGVLASQGWSALVCYVIAYGAFAFGYFARERFAALPGWWRRPIDWIANISYPLYAVHGVLGYTILVHAIESGLPSWAAVAVAIAAVICIATLLHRTIELPTQFYGKTLAKSKWPIQPLKGQGEPAAIS